MSKGYLLGPNAARKLSRLLGNTKGVGETVSGGAVVDTQEWPDPFTIRWSAANNAWLMLKGIVQYNGAELKIDGETPEGYQSPWIILSDLPAEASGMVYLNIDAESDSGATASVSLEATGTLSVPLAEISRGNDSLAVEVKQHVRSALVIASAGSSDEGGSITVDKPDEVAISMDYVSSESDEDFAYHPYAIRLRRGKIKIVNGKLSVVEDDRLKQFIDTVPHSAIMDSGSTT